MASKPELSGDLQSLDSTATAVPAKKKAFSAVFRIGCFLLLGLVLAFTGLLILGSRLPAAPESNQEIKNESTSDESAEKSSEQKEDEVITSPLEPQQEELKEDKKEEAPAEDIIDFTVDSQKDFSLGGCKRWEWRITVSENASTDEIDRVMTSIIEKDKDLFDAIAVFALKPSQKENPDSIKSLPAKKLYSKKNGYGSVDCF